MTTIAVLGANGRAGRRIVAEALRRGHHVTAVVRDPAAYLGPTGDRIVVVRGDVTDRDDVKDSLFGRDAIVSAVSSLQNPDVLFPAVAGVLAEVLPSGTRLLVIGIGTTLRVAAGLPLFETEGFPSAGKAFSTGHAAELDVLRPSDLDWLVVAPPPVVLTDDGAAGTGYATADGTIIETGQPFSYGDLASVVLDEIEQPRHHHQLLAVARAPLASTGGLTAPAAD